MWRRGLLIGALLVASAYGCQRPDASAQSKRPGRRGRPPIPVAVATATTGAISSQYITTATLEAEKTAPIVAQVKGTISAILKEEGDTVAKGRSLLRIDNAEYTLRLVQAQAKVARLADQFARLNAMVEKKLIGADEFERVKHELRAARAEEDLARLIVSRTSVVAPFAGQVVRRSVDVGQRVDDGTPLFELADMDPLLARVHVPSKVFKRLAKDQTVELTLDSSGVELKGRITLISPIIDPNSGTIKITVEISDYPKDTRPGDFAEVRIVTEVRKGSVLVPKIAVVEERSDRVVYVLAGDTVKRHVVKLGFEQDGTAEILSGLSLGDQVVVKGQNALKDGASVKVLETRGPSRN